MPDAELSLISVLGRDLQLVDIGGGRETHLVATEESLSARAAVLEGRAELLHGLESDRGPCALPSWRYT